MTVPALSNLPRAPRPPRPDLLTPAEVADVLGIKLKTLYNWRTVHRGPRAVRVGKFLRYSSDDIAEYIAEHTEGRVAS